MPPEATTLSGERGEGPLLLDGERERERHRMRRHEREWGRERMPLSSTLDRIFHRRRHGLTNSGGQHHHGLAPSHGHRLGHQNHGILAPSSHHRHAHEGFLSPPSHHKHNRRVSIDDSALHQPRLRSEEEELVARAEALKLGRGGGGKRPGILRRRSKSLPGLLKRPIIV